MMEKLLQNRKKEIIEQIGECELDKLKFSKLLKLLQNEIQALFIFYTIKQVYQMVKDVFNVNISAPLFYKFCARNIKKDEKPKTLKKALEEGISQKRDTKKEKVAILDDDELSAIAMFNGNKKD
jgi:hypothetical protein